MPFDYELGLDDKALYCVEMTQKAFMSAGIELCKPIRVGDMERAPEFPACMFGLRLASQYTLEHPLTFDTEVYFPGNERHGIWSAKQLMTVVAPTYSPGYPDISTGVMPTALVRAGFESAPSQEGVEHDAGPASRRRVATQGDVIGGQ